MTGGRVTTNLALSRLGASSLYSNVPRQVPDIGFLPERRRGGRGLYQGLRFMRVQILLALSFPSEVRIYLP